MHGLNIRVNISRDVHQDDVYGGSEYITGTLRYEQVPARLDYFISRTLRDLSPGIEVNRAVTFSVQPQRMDIQGEDVIQVVFPPHHEDYLRKFRVRGVQRESVHPSDPRAFIEIGAERIEESRTLKF